MLKPQKTEELCRKILHLVPQKRISSLETITRAKYSEEIALAVIDKDPIAVCG